MTSLKKRLKALGVALLGFRKGVTFNNKRGIALFAGLGRRIAKLASPFYDVRYRKDGRIFFQLRDRKAERKVAKKIRRILAG